MHPVCLEGKTLSRWNQKTEHIFKQGISWFAVEKHNHAKWKASITSVVSMFCSGLAFQQNEEKKKKDYSFQNKIMSCLKSTLAGSTKWSRIWPSSLNMYLCRKRNCQQRWSLISVAQKYILKIELIFACIASGTVMFHNSSQQTVTKDIFQNF